MVNICFVLNLLLDNIKGPPPPEKIPKTATALRIQNICGLLYYYICRTSKNKGKNKEKN